AGVDGPGHRRRVGAGQRPGAGAGLLERAEALVLRARPDLRDVEARICRSTERQRVGRAERGHVAGDDRAGAQFERIGAAGERNGVGLRAGAVIGEAAADRAAVDDREARADDAGTARARSAGSAGSKAEGSSARAAIASRHRAGVDERGTGCRELRADPAVAAVAAVVVETGATGATL